MSQYFALNNKKPPVIGGFLWQILLWQRVEHGMASSQLCGEHGQRCY